MIFQLTRDVENVNMTVSSVETLSVQGLGGDDIVLTHPLPFTSQTIDGGSQSAADTLTYEAGAACSTQTAGTFQTRGAGLVTHTGFETVSLLNNNQCPGVAMWLGTRRTA
jgi:hypothetical protein